MNPNLLVAAVLALFQLVQSSESPATDISHPVNRRGASGGRPVPSSSVDWVAKQHDAHAAAAIDSLLNMDTISFDHREAGHLIPADLMISASADVLQGDDFPNHSVTGYDSKHFNTADHSSATSLRTGNPESSASSAEESVVDVVTTDPDAGPPADEDETSANIVSDPEANTSIMNRTISEIFGRPRSDDHNRQLKDVARNAIISKMRDYKLDAFTQAFTANKRGIVQKGTNLIGILPGRYRDVVGKDQIILVGAHYDTVSTSAGIDDNASGMVVLLELARILMNQGQLNHTVMFVGFDLEELGLLGSIAFVREYLIPNELLAKKSSFLGAYVIDMALNYDPIPGSQALPRDIQMACPSVTAKIAQEGNRGDFIAVWVRQGVDGDVYKSLANEWKGSTKFKLRLFDPLLPSGPPTAADLFRFGTFTRSDHASFWYHKHPNFKKTLNAVLLTDMGPWRGSTGSKCYHNWCDDSSQLTERNLKFLKNTIDSLAQVILKSPPGAPSSPHDGEELIPIAGSGVPGSRRPPDRGADRGSRTNRGRGPTNRFMPPVYWPSFPSSFPSAFPSAFTPFTSPSFSRPFERNRSRGLSPLPSLT